MLTRPDAPAGRGRALAASPVAVLAREAGIEVLQPASLREPDVLAAAGRARPRLRPDRRLRRTRPAGCAGHPAARLGQPALLAAAGLARRGPGAARDLARRRHHRRDDLRPRGGPGHRPGLRHRHRADPRRTDTSGDLLARLAEAGSGLLLATLDAIEDGSAHAGPAGRASRPWPPRSPSTTPASGGTSRPSASTGRCARARRRPGRGRPAATSALRDRPGHRRGTTRTARAGTPARREARRARRHRDAARCASGWCAPAGKSAMAAADWARGAPARATRTCCA